MPQSSNGFISEIRLSFPCNDRLQKLINAAKKNPRFMRWFANSKVVDCNGDPLPVFHGTVKDFDTFSKASANSGGTAISTNYLGFYFSTEPETSNVYTAKNFDPKKGTKIGGNTKIVFLRINKPKLITEKEYWKLARKSPIEMMEYLISTQSQGYDGFFMPSVWRGKKGGIDIVAFEASQVQSVFASLNTDLVDKSDLDEANALVGGAVAGHLGPLWGKSEKDKKVKISSKLVSIHEGVELETEAPIIEPKRKSPTSLQALGIVKDGAVENIIRTYNEATPEEKEYWGKWYHNAKTEVQELAARYDLPFPVTAAAVAVLSPGNKWRFNMLAAERLLENITHPENPPLKIPGYPRQVARAKEIILTGNVGKVTGPKVTVFFKSLLDPVSLEKDLVLDGHAINIWRGEKVNLNSISSPTKAQRQQMLDDYHKAANILGVPVQAVQAVTWYVWKYTTDAPVVKAKVFDVSSFLNKVPDNDNALEPVEPSVSLESFVYDV